MQGMNIKKRIYLLQNSPIIYIYQIM